MRQILDFAFRSFVAVPAAVLACGEQFAAWSEARLSDCSAAVNDWICYHPVAYCCAVWFALAVCALGAFGAGVVGAVTR